MVEKITEIDVLCLDGSSDPVVGEVFILEPLGVVWPHDEVVEALGFSFIPRSTFLSEIMEHGWVKKNDKPDYKGGELPTWRLVREKLNTSEVSQQT